MVENFKKPESEINSVLTRIRDIFSENNEPTTDKFNSVVDLIFYINDVARQKIAIDYAVGHLNGWPDDIRVSGVGSGYKFRWKKIFLSDFGTVDAELAPLFRTLIIDNCEEDDLEPLLKSEQIKNITRLAISGSLSHFDYHKLSESQNLHGLVSLDLSFSHINVDAVNKIVSSKENFGNLREIRLKDTSFSGFQMNAFVKAMSLPKLEVLDLSSNKLDGYALADLAQASWLDQITTLFLDELLDPQEGNGLENLLNNQKIHNLRHLSFCQSDFTNEEAILIANCPYLSNLEYLGLVGISFQQEGKNALLNSKFLSAEVKQNLKAQVFR